MFKGWNWQNRLVAEQGIEVLSRGRKKTGDSVKRGIRNIEKLMR